MVGTKWGQLLLLLAIVIPIIFYQTGLTKEFENSIIVFAEEKQGKDNPIAEPIHMKLTLERVYLDGEISQEIVKETIWSMEDFWAKYDQWQLIDKDLGNLVFRRQMDDISPLLKTNGYFGITDEGVLTIFNGKPHKTNIIQSFFQIDLGKLESTKCKELKKGIPIMTKNRYVEVLETFKGYSKEDSKQAN